MIALGIESSHQRGMGHLYRALNLISYLRKVDQEAILFINRDAPSIQVLEQHKIPYEVVDYADLESNWESGMIHKYRVDLWIFDKFETDLKSAEHIKGAGVLLAAIDDCGEGAKLVDLHFCGMLFHNRQGKNIYAGKEYLILNSEIAEYRRLRTDRKKILVTLGGSDTYGVTIAVIKLLKKQGYAADIVTGPGFRHKEQLEQEIDIRFKIYETVPSLIAKFYEYDLAITGGGVTCFEANASGLPCVIIANELHEIENAKYLAGFGGAKFAGYYKELTEESFNIKELDIQKMSAAALKALPLNGVENIYRKIQEYRSKNYAG